MDHKALNVRNVGKKGENLEAINELVRLRLTALYLKSEDRCTAVREILFVKSL